MEKDTREICGKIKVENTGVYEISLFKVLNDGDSIHMNLEDMTARVVRSKKKYNNHIFIEEIPRDEFNKDYNIYEEAQADLYKAFNHPIWLEHNRGDKYAMDGKKDRWLIVYYPIYQDGKTQEYYKEPRALMHNLDKKGFWSKEVPLRYLKKIKL